MYKRLSENETKKYYRQILEDTIILYRKQLEVCSCSLYQDIYSQLLDIKENVVEKQLYKSWEEIDERYTLGGIAVKNYADNDEMQHRLCDIFSGAMDYSQFPE